MAWGDRGRYVALGRRHPVFIGSPSHPEIFERLNGFVDALAAHGIKPPLLRRDEFTIDPHMDSVRSLQQRVVSFDAMFASSDLLAMGAVRATLELGRSITGDVSVVGYDDVLLAARFIPPLSSVRQNWQESGVVMACKVLALFALRRRVQRSSSAVPLLICAGVRISRKQLPPPATRTYSSAA